MPHSFALKSPDQFAGIREVEAVRHQRFLPQTGDRENERILSIKSNRKVEATEHAMIE